MRKEIFVTTIEDLEEKQVEYNLEDCGMSGRHHGWHWYSDDEVEVDVYFKIKED